MSSSETQPRSPYKGLNPYDEKDAPFFFGREKETRLIIANLFASPLTLLYGASGVGKSSVLRAGVDHSLRNRDDLLVVVFNSWQSHPVSDLKQAVANCAKSSDHAKWARAARLVPAESNASLVEFLSNCASQLNRRLMIILDQFEEYFLYHPEDDEFAAEFPRAVTQSDAPVSFLISIREDFYAKLDRFEGRIPTLYDNYLRIEHLDREAARVAIEKPIAQYNRLYVTAGQQFSIEPKLVEAVLKQVETGRVILGEAGRGVVEATRSHEDSEAQIETPFLQLVMTRLWDEELLARSHKLRLETLSHLGGAENIVRTHLDAVIARLLPREQEIAASIFHYLVTPSGTKIAYTASDLAGSCELNEPEVVRVLERLSHGNDRILRPIDPTPDRPTAPRYEIFHDVLAPAIITWRTGYVQAQERAEAEQRAEEQQGRAEEQARIEEQAKVAARLRRLIVALAVLFLIALGTTAFALIERARANDRLHYAEGKLAVATEKAIQAATDKRFAIALQEQLAMDRDLARAKAEGESKRAEEQVRIANTKKAEADKARAEADTAQITAKAESKRAEDQASATRVAFSNLLSVESKTVLDEHPQLSTLLAVEALRATQKGDPPTPAGEEALRQSLAQVGGRVFGGEEWREDEGRSVKDVAVSSDGRWLASASESSVRLFDLTAPDANAKPRVLEGRDPVAFSADGRWLVARGKKPGGGLIANTVCLWDLTAGEHDSKPFVLDCEQPVTVAIVSPDNHWLVTGSEKSRIVQLWDLKSPDLTAGKLAAKTLVVDDSDGRLLTLAMSPNGRWLVTSSGLSQGGISLTDTGPARLWDLTAANPATKSFKLIGHKQPVTEAAFSPDGRWLVTGSYLCDDGPRLWNLKTSDPTAKPLVLDHNGSIGAVAFSLNNHWLATGSGRADKCPSDRTARVWDLTATDITTKPYVLPGQEGSIFAAAFTPDSGSLITVVGGGYSELTGLTPYSINGTRKLFTFGASGAAAHEWVGIAKGAYSKIEPIPNITMRDERISADSFAVSPNGRWLVATSKNNVLVWDTTLPYYHQAHVLRGHEIGLSVIGFSPDSRRLVTGSYDRTARLWDLSSSAFAASPLSFPANIPASNDPSPDAIAWSPDHRRLVATTNDPALGQGAVALVYNLSARDPDQPLVLRGHKGRIKAAAFSSDNRLLVTGSNDKTARLWDLIAPDPANLLVFAGHQGAVDDVAISADKRWLATASHDGTTQLWDLTAADPPGHSVLSGTFNSPVSEDYHYTTNRVYISPDSRWLVSSGHYSFRTPARLWDLKAPTPGASAINLGRTNPDDFAFSPDGRWLIMFKVYEEKANRLKSGALLWDLTKKPLAAPFILMSAPDTSVYKVAFSSDSRWLFTSSFEKVIRRWNLSAPDPSAGPFVLGSPLADPTEYLGDIFLSPDNRWLVADSGAQETHVLWDLNASDPNTSARVLPNPSGLGSSEVAFDPESQWLVTRNGAQNQRWDLTAADPAAAPVALPGGTLISGGAVSADGRWLITGAWNRVEFWNMRLDELRDLACRTAGRNLNEQDEWNVYFPGQRYRKTCNDLPARR
jgi:WD40 repeat protein